jgi:hypothetical protein
LLKHSSPEILFRAGRWLIFAAYAVLTLWLTAHHELWCDEADAWLMARDAKIGQIFSILPDAGHPPLWYLLLKVFSSAGLGWWSMQALNLVSLWTAAWLLLFRSGLGIAITLPFMISFVFSYEYPVIARNYGLGILGLFLYSAEANRLNQKGASAVLDGMLKVFAQALMCLSTVHFLALALVLFVHRGITAFRAKAIDRRNWILSEWPFLFCFLVSVVCLWPTGHGQFDANSFQNLDVGHFRDAVTNSLLPFEIPSNMTMTAATVAFGLILAGSPRRRDTIVIFLTGAAILTGIFVFKYYSGAPRHSGLLLVWLCASLWLTNPPGLTRLRTLADRRILPVVVLWALCLWNLPVLVDVWRLETQLNFSDAHEIASAIELPEFRDRKVVCWFPRNCLGILPYVSPGRRFWYPVLEREGTFDLWDATSHAANEKAHAGSVTFEQILAGARERFPDWGHPGGPLFVSNRRVPDPAALGLRLIVPASKTAWRVLDESFWLYGPVEEN